MASACVIDRPSYCWARPRISSGSPENSTRNPDPDPSSEKITDFDFRVSDELFGGGNRAPIHPPPPANPTSRIRSPDPNPEIHRSGAPVLRSIRWRELFRLKRQQQKKATTKNPNPTPLNRSSLTSPILQDSDSESISASSRLSSSSSSSSDTDNEEIHRLRLKNPRARDSEAALESPRLNSSGRVVFMGLERSSSSPGSFNRGLRVRHRGMERSYSAGFRVAPVLNVSVFGLGQLFVPQKKEREGSQGTRIGNGNIRNKIERERA